ncbi:MAG: nitrous oxide reductase family maturation protein NosD [Chloroflexi bacterium]|nr:nitrous oxide reductase family maturation protein NosD [Chloroflexota bacterium]
MKMGGLLTPLLLIAGLVIIACSGSNDASATDSRIGVFLDGSPIADLSTALNMAQDGSRIELWGGRYEGQFSIQKSISIQGFNDPLIDGQGRGSVFSISAPNVEIRGLTIKGSGLQLVHEHAAIEAEKAPGAVIEDNTISESLFGIYLRQSANSVIRNNRIVGKDLDIARRGDAIRVWYSADTIIQNNIVKESRDVVLWYSERLQIQGNDISDGRYGLHFMYSDDANVQNNRLINNSVGAFLMYSRRLSMVENVIGANRGPSGYGIGLKDMDDAVIQRNLFADNRVGAWVDNSPREIDSTTIWEGNVFTLNDFGLRIMPSVHDNHYTANSFADNQEQVQVAGGGDLMDNNWSVDGVGNYWSDYAGYDADSDGIGDVAYKSEHLFEDLALEHPEARILTYSPAAQAIEFAARALPFFRPEAKFTDPAPMMSPAALPGLSLNNGESRAGAIAAPFGLLAVAFGAIAAVRRSGGDSPVFQPLVRHSPLIVADSHASPALEIRGLRKRFGKVEALRGINFTIERGESVALWGSNGAGKTTALRCILGLVPSQGEINICGIDMRKDGREGRRRIGVVPQEIGFHSDLTVNETMLFYRQIRSAPSVEGAALLERVGLTMHADKQVRQLSGGLRQRLALAVALLGNPEVLLLDEPTTNLDAGAREEFLRILEELRDDSRTFIFASHRPGEVFRLADRVIVLDEGLIVKDAIPAECLGDPRNVTSMRIEVGSDNISAAVSALAEQGMNASRNHTGVRVGVPTDSKATALAVLLKAGFPVSDFDLEETDHDAD